jgi:ATP-dependent Clp protease adaptor protein ClpS
MLTMDEFELNKYEDTVIKERHEVKSPSLYRVFLLNDDYTTMDFVIEILEDVFHKSAVEAAQIMLLVHKNGKGLAGVYTREIAETKIHNVNEFARKSDFPLKCIMEKG